MAWNTDEGWRGVLHSCATMARWPDEGESDETGFALAHGRRGVWPYLSKRLERLRRFVDMMRLFSRRPGLQAYHVMDGYPWGDLPDRVTLVDVGGSHGVLACAVTRHFHLFNFVVQIIELRGLRLIVPVTIR